MIQPDHALSAASIATVDDALYAVNARATGRDDARAIAFTVRDDAGEITAAAIGHSWAGTAELKLLWVAETLQGQGIGSRLLDAFVTEARVRGALRLWVSSHDFQAPEFYEHHGFARMATFDDWPEGHANVFLCKRL